MLIEQIIEFEWRGPGPPGRACTPKTAYFYGNKNLYLKSLSGVLCTVKLLQEAMCLTFLYLGQITYKMQHQNVRS